MWNDLLSVIQGVVKVTNSKVAEVIKDVKNIFK